VSDDYSQYEKESKLIREENAKLLDLFSGWLKKQGLSETTVNQHRSNVNFYINEFLLYEDAERPEAGVHRIEMFLGYWFIRKAMWASKTTIKANGTSLKKLYKFMVENGRIRQEDFDAVRNCIKEDMPDWLATLERYDDPNIEDPFEVWDIYPKRTTRNASRFSIAK
jgi:site-specific recombinase XerD